MLLERSLVEAIEFGLEQGFGGFEVWADFPHAHPDQVEQAARAPLRKRLRAFSQLSMHAPLGNASLASINPGIWRESLRQHLDAVRLASDLGIGVLVVHPGDLRDARLKRAAWDRCVEALGKLAQSAEREGVTLALENCGRYLGSLDETVGELRTLLDSVHSTRLKACLDVGHAAVNGNLEDLLELVGEDVVHLHVHDNDGRRDAHLPMGWGSINFASLRPLATRAGCSAVAEVVWAQATGPAPPGELAKAALTGWSRLVQATPGT
jgi:sugar phosphate isomerase/epimerase